MSKEFEANRAKKVAEYRAILEAEAASPQAQGGEPIGWVFQHDDTGRMTFCENDGINTPEVFQRLNPRHTLCGPAYTTPQRAPGVTEEMVERAAEAVWNGRSHKLLEKSGYPTAWSEQPRTVQLDCRKEARAAIKAALAAPVSAGDGDGLVGELVEMGDDEDGNPRLVIHTTREAIKAAKLPMFRSVSVAPIVRLTSGASGVDGLVAKWREPLPDDECTLYTMGKRAARLACAEELATLTEKGA